ncbi:hypothetical protein [Lichenihabitans psoromatis]|uniref:hypothetical protein n=1 Tax=Lichenihabitans psoromatis TaxID=2528642 RepID=UPI00103844B8|nr:hypothetical protein [Lichenihabitans psoromatis]
MMTVDQIAAGLAAIVGGGGLSAIIVATFAYLTEARKGRKPSDGSLTMAIGEGFQRGKWDEIAASHLGLMAYAMVKLVAIKEVEAEETIQDRSFHDRVGAKIDRLVIDALRAEMGRKG